MSNVAFPVLMGQTPRGGRWNHVALLPNVLPAGTDAAAYLSTAAIPGGANFVAVAADVEQPATGRVGRETLVLIGVQVPDGERRAALEAWLRERLADLGAWVAGFDWDTHVGGPAVMPALPDWSTQAVSAFDLRPHPLRTHRPLLSDGEAPPRPRGWLLTLAAAVAGAVLLTAGLSTRCARDPAPPAPLDRRAGRSRRGTGRSLGNDLCYPTSTGVEP